MICNYPNDKYRFVRRAIICYYSNLAKRDEDIPYTFDELMKFYELCYLSYCKERNY